MKIQVPFQYIFVFNLFLVFLIRFWQDYSQLMEFDVDGWIQKILTYLEWKREKEKKNENN